MARARKLTKKPAVEARESRAAAPTAPAWRIDLGISLFLAAAIFAAYAQVRHFEFLNLDDPSYFRNPHPLHGWTREGLLWAFRSTTAANWYPLTWISFMLFRGGSGEQHLINVLIHAASSVLLFFVLHRMTGARWPSAFVAFVFGLHPLHVESVAWIAERKDVLSAFFWILTMGAYLFYVERPGPLRYLVTVLMFVLGLMSKAMLVTLPFALLLMDVWPLGRFRAKSRLIYLEKIPLILLSFGASAITYYAQRTGGAVASLDQIPLGGRLGNALLSYAAYLFQFLWPVNLAVFYPYRIPSLPLDLLCAAALIGITIFSLRSRSQPYIAVGWLWYLGTLVPVIGLVQVGSQARADRYTYVPLIGISMMVAWGAAELIRRGKLNKISVGIGAAAVCSLWFFITANQVSYWHDNIALFEHAIQVTSDNDFAYNSLGAALRQQGHLDLALADMEHAAALRPESSATQNNLGETLLREGRTAEALPHFTEAVRLNPRSAEARVNLATALNLTGRVTEAEAQYRIALAYDPDSAEAHGGLGVVLNETGRTREALPELQVSVELSPNDAAAHYNLGRLYSATGEHEAALRQYQDSVRLNPQSVDAHISLGAAFTVLGRFPEALLEFQAAERLNPDSAGAHFNAALALAALERYDDAIAEFTTSLKLKPDLTAAKADIEYYSKLRSKPAAAR